LTTRRTPKHLRQAPEKDRAVKQGKMRGRTGGIWRLCVGLLPASLTLAACGSGGGGSSGPTSPVVTPTPALFTCNTPAPAGFRVVGYMPAWQGSVDEIAFARLTHINYAFALPTANGGLQPVQDLPKLQALVARGHEHGVRVLISIGGWNDGDDSAFTALAASRAGRRSFAEAVARLVADQGLDGVDIDWEYPEATEAGSYAALINELSVVLRPAGKLLTAAVTASSWGSEGIANEALPDLDWLNIMAYDGGSGADHSPYSYAVSALDFWAGRGLPRQKTVLGVPFYSRPGERSYAWLVANHPDAPYRDEVGGEYYNGIDTIRRKTCLARQRASGVMIWELSQDTHDSTSLLAAISAP
jgi:GH18 family chitinase